MFRTFFPHKLEKHQKSCTKDKPMINPNKVKGVASKLESLVNYPEHKLGKHRKKDENTQVTPDQISCICCQEETMEEEEVAVDLFLGNDEPTLKDFIDFITNNEVLEDKELSKELLFLMNYFVTMKNAAYLISCN